MVKLRSNNLILLGDTHGVKTTTRIVEEKFPEGCDVLHLGDFGLGFGHHDKLNLNILGNLCKKKQIDLYAIRGNHDDPAWWPGEHENVHLIEDYTILQFENGDEMLCIGGGISVDRYERRENISWWVGELTEVKPELCQKTKFLALHDAPSYFNVTTESIKKEFPIFAQKDKTLIVEANEQRARVDAIVDLVQPKYIFGGHYHNSCSEEVNGIRYRCLDVNESYELKADWYE